MIPDDRRRTAEHSIRRPLSGLVVLLVTRDAALRHELAPGLARAGATVRSTSSAEDARDVLALERLDALVLDGASEAGRVLRDLRQLPELDRRIVPAIALGDVEAVREVDAQLAKPVRLLELVALLARITGATSSAPALRLPRIA